MTTERIVLPVPVPYSPGDTMRNYVPVEITHLAKPDGSFTLEDVEQAAREEYARRGWTFDPVAKDAAHREASRLDCSHQPWPRPSSPPLDVDRPAAPPLSGTLPLTIAGY